MSETEYANLIHWSQIEEVEVTLISCDPDGITSTFLVQRVGSRDQFVLSFRESDVLINGQILDLGDAVSGYCALADEILTAPNGGVVGRRVRCEAPPV
jgi:hypothetical protein